jgi:hypothetical protein
MLLLYIVYLNELWHLIGGNMFGHQDEKHDDDDNNAVAAQTSQQANDVSDLNLSLPGSTPTLGAESTGDESAEDAGLREALSPAGGYPQATDQKVHPGSVSDDVPVIVDDAAVVSDGDIADIADGDLVVVKTKALNELFPLIDKLDQTPDERFRTLMMMIQASDNQHLVEAAYEAAHSISDEKARAQALLDVVNEINYFTHQPES